MGGGTMRSLHALVRAEMATFVRDRASLLLTFLFPVLFILIFGSLMGDMGSTDDIAIGVVATRGDAGDSLRTAISASGTLRFNEYETVEQLLQGIETGSLDFGVVWEDGLLVFYYDPRRIQENVPFQEVARGIASRLRLAAQGLEPVVVLRTIPVGGQPEVPWIHVAVPGILAFSILSAGLSAIAGHVTSMKQRKLLDRLIVTPMRPTLFLLAVVIVRLLVTFASTLITLLLAVVVFGLRFDVNWLQYCVLVVSATVGMMGLGTAISLLVRQASSAGHISTILSITMMFISGIYFPIEIMPRFLRVISYATPLRHMAEAMRYATGVMEMSPARFWIISAALFALGALLLPLLARYVVRSGR